MDDEELFSTLRTESVFKNAKSLAQSWIPAKDQKLLCRDEEIKKLSVIHRPIIENQGEYSTNTLILGNGGLGKTLTIKYFASRFKEFAVSKDIKIIFEYFDCLQYRTKSAILRWISEKIHYNAGHGYSDNEIMVQILQHIKKENQYLMIVLDEVHNIPQDDILALLNASIGFGSGNARFSIICISRPSDWYKVENEKIMSRMQEVIKMEPYTKEEAIEILSYRRNLAFREGVLEDPEIDLIASIVEETKNMRNGIDIMRSCGIHCDEQNLSHITSNLILESRRDINPTFRSEIIDHLNEQEQLTLLAIAYTLKENNAGVTNVEDTYKNYEVKCEERGIKPHVIMSYRKYIRNLSAQKAIATKYLNPTIEKKGRQLEIRLSDISPEQLIEYLEKIIPQSNN